MTDRWCDDHLDAATDAVGSRQAAGTYLVVELLDDDEFFALAYRMHNGRRMPATVEPADMPMGDHPDADAITAAMDRVAPACCWLDDRGVSPVPAVGGEA